MTTYSGPASLQRCLRALDAQTQDPASFEVVVVDSGSTGETVQPLDGPETRFALRVVRLGGAEATAGLAAAVEAAEGRICIFLGDDVAAMPELIGSHLAVHATNERLVGVGRLTEVLPGSRDWYARAAAVAWNRRFDSSNGPPLRWRDLHLENASVARTALAEVGGLPGASGPAPATVAELACRLDSAGYEVRYLPAAHGVRQRDASGRRLLAERAGDGGARAELWSRQRSGLPGLLGSFTDGSPRELVLRRSMLSLRARPAMLAALGRLVPGAGRKQQWFIFVSNYAYWDAVRKRLAPDTWRQLAHGVPVLLYHAFGEVDESSRFVVTRRVFARQMRLLSLLRYTVLPYDEFARSIREGRLPPPRTAVVTIDDGYVDNGDIAAPILESHGFGATIFLVSGRLGAVNDWSDAAPLRGRRLLAAQRLDSLRKRGIEFGAHTRTHRSLLDLADETMAEEVESSRKELEHALGNPVDTFAYPYGRLDDRAVAAVERAGFLSACTTDPRLAGLDDDPLLIPRLEIKRSDSLPLFLRKVWFGGA
jgi:peptidoglycan/xylan/chitin deacetylase (PgdA/CDA1 family)